MKTRIVALIAFLALAACSQTKQLEEMHDSTKEMNETTKDMSKSTSDLSKKMTSMSETTDHLDGQMSKLKNLTNGLCRGSSQALPLQARQMTLNQMDRAVTGLDKVNWAVTYIEGFDFQVWPLCQANESEIDHMLDDATLEFFQVVQRYDSGKMPNPFVEKANVDEKGDAIDDADAKDLSFNTIAYAMSFVNRHQLDNHDKDANAPVITFMSLIEDTLREGLKVERGEKSLSDLKQYQRDLLANRNVAVKLLQARQQMSTAVVVGLASKVAMGSMKNSLNMALDRYIKLFKIQPKAWQFNADSWNEAVIDRNTKMLKDAVEVRAYLKSIGVEPVMNKNLGLLLKGMTFTMTKGKVKTLSKEGRSARTDLIKSIHDLQATL